MADRLEEFPVVIEIPVAWGEMDAFGHVNNIFYFRYFESARIEYFRKIDYIGLMEETGLGPILASTQCTYRYPLTYPDRVLSGARVSHIAGDRFTMEYQVFSLGHEKKAAEGEGIIVNFNYRTSQKADIPLSLKQRIEILEQGGHG